MNQKQHVAFTTCRLTIELRMTCLKVWLCDGRPMTRRSPRPRRRTASPTRRWTPVPSWAKWRARPAPTASACPSVAPCPGAITRRPTRRARVRSLTWAPQVFPTHHIQNVALTCINFSHNAHTHKSFARRFQTRTLTLESPPQNAGLCVGAEHFVTQLCPSLIWLMIFRQRQHSDFSIGE
jgi:hypothetical protein